MKILADSSGPLSAHLEQKSTECFRRSIGCSVVTTHEALMIPSGISHELGLRSFDLVMSKMSISRKAFCCTYS